MKTIIAFAFGMFFLTSCDVYVVEPVVRDHRSSIIGSYDFDEYSDTYDEYVYYRVEVYRGYSGDQILLHNFYGIKDDVIAYFDGSNISIPFQVVNGFEIEGDGYLQYDKLILDYRVFDRYHASRADYCDTEAIRVY